MFIKQKQDAMKKIQFYNTKELLDIKKVKKNQQNDWKIKGRKSLRKWNKSTIRQK